MTDTAKPASDEISPAQAKANLRAEALKAYRDANSVAEKRKAIEKYPLLKEIYSEVNHHVD